MFLELLPEPLVDPEPDPYGDPEGRDERSCEPDRSDYVRMMNMIDAIAAQLREQGLRMAASRGDLYALLLVKFESVEIVSIAE